MTDSSTKSVLFNSTKVCGKHLDPVDIDLSLKNCMTEWAMARFISLGYIHLSSGKITIDVFALQREMAPWMWAFPIPTSSKRQIANCTQAKE